MIHIRNIPMEMLHSALRATLEDWRIARQHSLEKNRYAVGARFSMHLGLPGLAAAFEELDHLEAGLGPVTRDEAVHAVARIVTILLGECQTRILLAFEDETALVPGASQVVDHVLERMLKKGV